MLALVLGGLLFANASAQSAATVDFNREIVPIFEQNCTGCHHAGTKHFDLTSRTAVFNGKLIVPGKPDASLIYTSVASGAMPPGGKLNSTQIEALARWIKAGAEWPQDAMLKVPVKAAVEPNPANSELENVRSIRERIAAKAATNEMQPYNVTIPRTTIAYKMVPVPAGHFQMGSTEKPDEQPPHQVTLDAFWMQSHEVTWDEYRLFMFAKQANEISQKDETVDAVSRPTRPYVEMSFGMGINGFPAISMTQHAANKYAEWLSAKTGEFYRLPTEAEWEYACRAGTTTPYYFGGDASQLKDYAWFAADSGGKYQPVATKKPNAWGLYDMLGNAMEWTLDGYAPYTAAPQTDPWVKATQPYPNSVRGGSWNDPAGQLTCASRVASDASWKQQDPQLPKSIWYETDAQWLGFRLVRPAKLPSAEEMLKYWNSGFEHDEQ
jgi:formylglycine-generating enzyme required for sulfatase activity